MLPPRAMLRSLSVNDALPPANENTGPERDRSWSDPFCLLFSVSWAMVLFESKRETKGMDRRLCPLKQANTEQSTAQQKGYAKCDAKLSHVDSEYGLSRNSEP